MAGRIGHAVSGLGGRILHRNQGGGGNFEVSEQEIQVNPQVAALPQVPAPNSKSNFESQTIVPGESKKAPSPGPILDEKTIFYGSPDIDPQTLAQARAEYMARVGRLFHFGGGIVQTNVGTLAEGIGWTNGTGTPGTCVATNGTAAIADGIATGPYGTYRARLYDSPGTTNGSEGGRVRFFRRR